jgi:transmembrane sensor
MTTTPHDQALDEAATWFSRLKTRSIETGVLEEFFAWQAVPENREAFARVEAMWRQGAGLEKDPDIGRAVEEALRPRAAAPRRRSSPTQRYRAIAASVIAASVLATAAFTLTAGGQTHQTDVGERRQIALSDGSTVQLDTDSKLTVRYGRGERSVSLQRGQALFVVAKDPARPFVVSAGLTRVRALGTQFDVRRERGVVAVTLLQGKVQVRDDNPLSRTRWTLSPGQQVKTGRASTPPVLTDPALATSWTTGRLVFRELPLASAIEEANRYSDRKIRLAARDDLANVRVNGVFNAGDVDALAASISELYDLEAERSDSGDILLRPATP